MTDGGIAILDQGSSFGGGALASFGINSNTSANGFIKCSYAVPKRQRKAQMATIEQAPATPV